MISIQSCRQLSKSVSWFRSRLLLFACFLFIILGTASNSWAVVWMFRVHDDGFNSLGEGYSTDGQIAYINQWYGHAVKHTLRLPNGSIINSYYSYGDSYLYEVGMPGGWGWLPMGRSFFSGLIGSGAARYNDGRAEILYLGDWYDIGAESDWMPQPYDVTISGNPWKDGYFPYSQLQYGLFRKGIDGDFELVNTQISSDGSYAFEGEYAGINGVFEYEVRALKFWNDVFKDGLEFDEDMQLAVASGILNADGVYDSVKPILSEKGNQTSLGGIDGEIVASGLSYTPDDGPARDYYVVGEVTPDGVNGRIIRSDSSGDLGTTLQNLNNYYGAVNGANQAAGQGQGFEFPDAGEVTDGLFDGVDFGEGPGGGLGPAFSANGSVEGRGEFLAAVDGVKSAWGNLTDSLASGLTLSVGTSPLTVDFGGGIGSVVITVPGFLRDLMKLGIAIAGLAGAVMIIRGIF